MTPLERYKLRYYRSTLSLTGMMPATPEEALEMALDAEAKCKAVGVQDISWGYFVRLQTNYEQIALLLEKENASK